LGRKETTFDKGENDPPNRLLNLKDYGRLLVSKHLASQKYILAIKRLFVELQRQEQIDGGDEE
jgi:hypothetical protein